MDMHDDEIRARLGMPIGEGSMSDRIEAHMLRSMPEPQAVEEIENNHPWSDFTSPSNEELVEAVRDLLKAVDEERARMLAAMHDGLRARQADFLRQVNEQANRKPEPRVLSADEVRALGADQLEKLREMTGRAAVADPDHPSASLPTCACRGRYPEHGWFHAAGGCYATGLEPK